MTMTEMTNRMETKDGFGREWQLGPFVKLDEANPVLEPHADAVFRCPIAGEVRWEQKDVFNPAAVVRDEQVYMLYRAEDAVGQFKGTSRIGLAVSPDGVAFRKRRTPVLHPDRDYCYDLEWEGGCEDPRVVEDEHGTYYMTYTAYDGDKARLCVATSRDLATWTKHGLAFGEALAGKYADIWCKSGSIVCRRRGGRFVAEKINGSYWMYWGETNIYAAVSADLLNWTPVEASDAKVNVPDPYLLPIVGRRRNRFDSGLVEPGPQAMLTDAGILLLYNSKNDALHGDPRFPAGSYCAGQVLLDAEDPTSVIARSVEPFLVPDKTYEMEGQVNHVCFIEGLVYFNNEWLLYYGTADSKIAVAKSSDREGF